MYLLNSKEMLDFVRERADVFDHAGRSNPFACSAWVLNFIEQVADERWTFVVPEHLVNDRSSFMLLYQDSSLPHRRAAATNYYASLYSPLISAAESVEERRGALAELVEQLDRLRPRCASISLAPMEEAAEDTLALHQTFASRGWYVKSYFCFGNWYLPCAGLSFSDYMSQRDSKLQNTWVRKAKKFKAGGKDGGRLEIVTDPAGVGMAMDAYERIYAKSWKQPEPYPNFVRNWAEICARNGWLRLGLAWAGDTPIAAQLWFTMNRRAYIFKLAYDEEYTKWSAGTVLSAHLFRHAMDEDKVIEIDYLTGDDAYKRSWMTQRRERIGLIACDLRTPRGLMVATGELAGKLRRQLLTAIRPNTRTPDSVAATAVN